MKGEEGLGNWVEKRGSVALVGSIMRNFRKREGLEGFKRGCIRLRGADNNIGGLQRLVRYRRQKTSDVRRGAI